jgi:hypothetical protein
MFSDPFGLLAMDVEYGDDRTKADVDALRKKSKTFDAAVKKLEDDHTVLVKIGRGNTAVPGCGGGAGCARSQGTNEKGQAVYDVTINDGGIQSENALFSLMGSLVNAMTTLGHEVYGHVVPWTQGWHCADGAPGTPAAQSCSVRRENIIRREIPVPLRPVY